MSNPVLTRATDNPIFSRRPMTKSKPIAEYAWCVVHETAGLIYSSFGETRSDAKERFEHGTGKFIKSLPHYRLVKVYVATAKG